MRARGAAAGESLSLHRSEYRALIEWAERRKKLLPLSYIERFQPVTTGAKHAVYYDPERGVAVKATHSNRFGHSADGVQLSATPLEYLRRLGWDNVLFDDDIRIEGIAADEEQMEVVTTQPWINVHRDAPNPTRAEIDAYFANLQFDKAALTERTDLLQPQNRRDQESYGIWRHRGLEAMRPEQIRVARGGFSEAGEKPTIFFA